jgi:Sec-independent protein translocase protein TatA
LGYPLCGIIITQGIFPFLHKVGYKQMANKNVDMYKGTDIVFADGKVRTVKPLTIRSLREFMKVANEMKSTDEGSLSDDDIDKMVAAAKIALKKVDPELAADEDALEDALDLRSFQELMSVAMGGDPNQ